MTMKNESIRNQFSQLEIVFNLIVENQPVVFVKQSVVYIINVKNKNKSIFIKECKEREINTKC